MNFIIEKNSIYLKDENEKVIAEVNFPPLNESTVNINKTFVDPILRGQGIAGKLMKSAADELRKDGRKAVFSCSYAVDWFEKNSEEYRDIFAE